MSHDKIEVSRSTCAMNNGRAHVLLLCLGCDGNLFTSNQRYSIVVQRGTLWYFTNRLWSTSNKTCATRSCHCCTYYQRKSRRGQCSLVRKSRCDLATMCLCELGFQTEFGHGAGVELSQSTECLGLLQHLVSRWFTRIRRFAIWTHLLPRRYAWRCARVRFFSSVLLANCVDSLLSFFRNLVVALKELSIRGDFHSTGKRSLMLSTHLFVHRLL